ncbi:MAG: serine protease [Natronospirillum sp.]
MMYRLGMAMLVFMLATTAAGFSFEPKIVGGSEVNYGDADPNNPRYIVGVFPGGGICGGSYIGNRRVITAAHCTEGVGYADIRVGFTDTGEMFNWVGQDLYFSLDVDLVDVVAVIEYVDYELDTTFNNDVAVIILAEDPPIYIEPIAFATKAQTSQIISNRSVLTAYGWGALIEGGEYGNGVSEDLMKVDLRADTMSYCRSKYSQSAITSNMICAGGQDASDDGKDSCQGDSGGPLVYDGAGGPVLVGITSFGRGCARDNVPGVYARAAVYAEWADAITEEYIAFNRAVIGPRIGNGSFGFGLLIILLGGLLVRRR